MYEQDVKVGVENHFVHKLKYLQNNMINLSLVIIGVAVTGALFFLFSVILVLCFVLFFDSVTQKMLSLNFE